MAPSGTQRDPRGLARALLEDAVDQGIFPAGVAEVGDSHTVLWREAFGTLTFDADALPTTEQTIFDLASLTKPVATTSIVMELVERHAVDLHDLVTLSIPEWLGPDRELVTVTDLLEHASGLPARLVDPPGQSRRELEHEICAIKLEAEPRTRSIYSDLGFLLLGFLAEDRGGTTLADQWTAIFDRVRAVARVGSKAGLLAFEVPHDLRSQTAPTYPLDNDLRRGERLVAAVHDDYAAALGGAAGHAGLFGTADAVGTFARAVLRSASGDAAIPSPLSPPLVARATRRSRVPGSSRALGWDTMLPTSSCGTELSPAAFGHVGFTGTSLWIDPVLERYFVLLTNRAGGGGTSDQMQTVRRRFHDLLAKL
jgi:CubicO group peptidase (beta-lactamase class C family)